MNMPQEVILEDVECPLRCNRNDELLLVGRDLIHNIPGDFSVIKCQTCKLVRTSPRPTSETIGMYYPVDYAPYHSNAVDENSDKSRIKSWLRLLLGLNARMLPPVSPGRMLEVGCSTGTYMERVRRMGWEVDGIELSQMAATTARGKGFYVQTTSLEKAKAPDVQYDVITAWMVLEHLHEPVSALKKLRGWTKPDGYLVALVPDADSLSKTVFKELSYDLHLPNHLYHYTPETLELVLAKAGWKLERIFWQRNCSTLLRSFEYWAAEKRKMNILRFAKWLRIGKISAPIRVLLSHILGITRQSGRIEIWAKPFAPFESINSIK